MPYRNYKVACRQQHTIHRKQQIYWTNRHQAVITDQPNNNEVGILKFTRMVTLCLSSFGAWYLNQTICNYNLSYSHAPKNIYGSHIKERGQLHMVSTDSIYSVRQWLLLQPALQDPKSVAGCWQLKLQSATVNKIDDKEDQEQRCKERHESLLQKR